MKNLILVLIVLLFSVVSCITESTKSKKTTSRPLKKVEKISVSIFPGVESIESKIKFIVNQYNEYYDLPYKHLTIKKGSKENESDTTIAYVNNDGNHESIIVVNVESFLKTYEYVLRHELFHTLSKKTEYILKKKIKADDIDGNWYASAFHSFMTLIENNNGNKSYLGDTVEEAMADICAMRFLNNKLPAYTPYGKSVTVFHQWVTDGLLTQKKIAQIKKKNNFKVFGNFLLNKEATDSDMLKISYLFEGLKQRRFTSQFVYDEIKKLR